MVRLENGIDEYLEIRTKREQRLYEKPLLLPSLICAVN